MFRDHHICAMEKFLQRSSHKLRSAVKTKKQVGIIVLIFASLFVFMAIALRKKNTPPLEKKELSPHLPSRPQGKIAEVITTAQLTKPSVALNAPTNNLKATGEVATPQPQDTVTSLHTYDSTKRNAKYGSTVGKYAALGGGAILLGGLLRNYLNSQTQEQKTVFKNKEHQTVSENKEECTEETSSERTEDEMIEEKIFEQPFEVEGTKNEVDQNILRRFRYMLHRKNKLKAEMERLRTLVNERRTLLEAMNNRNKLIFDTNAGLLMHIQLRQDAFAEMTHILTIVLAEENLLTKTLQTTKTNHATIVSSHNTKRDCDMHCKYRSLLRPLVLHHLVKTRFPSQLGARTRQAAFGFSFMGLVNSIPPFTPFMTNKLPVQINDAIRFTLPMNTNAAEALLNIGGYALSQSFKPEEKGFILLARYHYFASELQKLQRQDETIAAMLSELLKVYNDSNSMYEWLNRHELTDEFKEIKKEEEQWL